MKAVAEALRVHEQLDRDGIDEAIGDTDIYSPVFEVQHACGLLRPVGTPPTAGAAKGVVVARHASLSFAR